MNLTHLSYQEQLARNGTTESKSKVSTFREFSRTSDFDGLSLVSAGDIAYVLNSKARP